MNSIKIKKLNRDVERAKSALNEAERNLSDVLVPFLHKVIGRFTSANASVLENDAGLHVDVRIDWDGRDWGHYSYQFPWEVVDAEEPAAVFAGIQKKREEKKKAEQSEAKLQAEIADLQARADRLGFKLQEAK